MASTKKTSSNAPDSSYLEKLRNQIHKQIEVHPPAEPQPSPDSAYLEKLRKAMHKQIEVHPPTETQHSPDRAYLEKLRNQIHKQIEIHPPTETQHSPDRAYLEKLRNQIHKQIEVHPRIEIQQPPDRAYLEKLRNQIHKQIEIERPPRLQEAGTKGHQDDTPSLVSESRTLLSVATLSDLTESIGTVISGVRLSTLTNQQLDELATLMSERGVVFLRDQGSGLEQQTQVLKRYGTIGKDPANGEKDSLIQDLSPEQQREWRSDASFEEAPPSYSFLSVEENSKFSHETAWASQYGLYDELSKHMKGFLDSLHAVHTSPSQRISSSHPAVITHPVTKLRALNVTPGFVTAFADLKKKESDKLLEFLDYHIRSEDQHSVRWKWKAGDIAIWDNRCTAYKNLRSSAASDWPRATPIYAGEKPYFNSDSESREEKLQRLAKAEQEEKDRLDAIKARYNNTPLRRILSRQLLKEQYERKIDVVELKEVVPDKVIDKVPSRADSVLSDGDAEPQPPILETSEDRTERWTRQLPLELEKRIFTPARKGNTPLRRILERQVSGSLERRLQWV